MKINVTNHEEKDIIAIIGKWANLTNKEMEGIKYVDDLLKIANEYGIKITIEKKTTGIFVI